jgi:hypothetical protein
MEDIFTREGCENDYFDKSPAFDGERNRREPRKSDLTARRWRLPNLQPAEEAELIRLAQAGDGPARDEIAKRFHKTALAIAKQYHGPPFEDLLGAALLGLSEAIARYDPRRNNGLRAYAEGWIRKCVRLEAKRWRKRGQAGESRADRFVYDNRGATPAEVATKVGCTPKEAEGAIARADSYWHGHKGYVELRYDSDDKFIGTELADSSVMCRLWDCYSGAQLSPQLWPFNALSIWVDELAAHSDKQAARRLRRIGRRAYALELVARDRARAARADPFRTAAPIKPKCWRPIARRPQIRSWRSFELTPPQSRQSMENTQWLRMKTTTEARSA